MFRGQGRNERRASHDIQVYRDQLQEIDTELARGVLSESDAGATRTEISRRLLSAADAEKTEEAAGRAPATASRITGLAVAACFALLAAGIYKTIGAPGYQDQPLAERALNRPVSTRPSQEAAEGRVAAQMAAQGLSTPPAPSETVELIDRLITVLQSRPDDVKGHRLLAGSLAGTGRFAEARVAQQRVVSLLGKEAGAPDLIRLAELLVLAASGYISPEAEEVLNHAQKLAPENPALRYLSGRALLQEGNVIAAYEIWNDLLNEGTLESPWMDGLKSEIDLVARSAGVSTTSPAGPTQDQVKAAGEMSQEDRMQMISGMVDQLSERLATEGGPPGDWARLITSLAVLGKSDDAQLILDEANLRFTGNSDALAILREAAQKAGLAN